MITPIYDKGEYLIFGLMCCTLMDAILIIIEKNKKSVKEFDYIIAVKYYLLFTENMDDLYVLYATNFNVIDNK